MALKQLFYNISIILTLLYLLIVGNTYAKSHVITNKIYVVFRIDDFGLDNARFYDQLIKIINNKNSALTIGVVPFRKEKKSYFPIPDSLLEKLRIYSKSNTGIEIALHGYCHENNMISGGTSEFISLDRNIQLKKIIEGKNLLESKLHIRINTFIPPWNNFDANTTYALYLARFIGISTSSYSLIGENDIAKNLMYIPYTISLTRLMGNNDLVEDLIRLPNNSIVVVLFHGFDFIENQHFYSQQEKTRYKSTQKIRLNDFAKFIQTLNNTRIVNFCNFNQLYANQEIDLSYKRYLHSSIGAFTIKCWPRISLESLSYLELNDINLKNIYYTAWPFIFYSLIFFSGYFFSIVVLRDLKKKLRSLTFSGVILSIFSILGVIFFQESLKYLVFISFLFGFVIGFFFKVFLLASRNNKIKNTHV